MAPSVVCADEPTTPSKLWRGGDWLVPGAFVDDDKTGKPPSGNQTLLLFCEEGYLVDRGVTNSLFAGLAETWIIDRLSKEADFRQAIGLSEEQATKLRQRDRTALVDVPSPFTLKSRLETEALTELEKQLAWPDSAHLHSGLTAEQRLKLPAIFLQLEGLAALRRIEFRELIGLTLAEQREIAGVFDACNNDFALDHHKGLFTLRNDNLYLAPSIALRLRLLSVALDHQILRTLNEEQQRRLAPIVAETKHLAGVVRGAGAYSVGEFVDR